MRSPSYAAKKKVLSCPVVQLRSYDRSTDRGAELVPPKRLCCSYETVPSVEGAVPDVFPGGCVQLVGSGSGYDVDDSPDHLAKLRLVIVGLELEFLDRIHDRRNEI